MIPSEIIDLIQIMIVIGRRIMGCREILLADEEDMEGFIKAVPNIKGFPRVPRPVDMAELLKEIERKQ